MVAELEASGLVVGVELLERFGRDVLIRCAVATSLALCGAFSLHTLKAPAGPPLAIASPKAPLSFAKAYAMIFGPSRAGSGLV